MYRVYVARLEILQHRERLNGRYITIITRPYQLLDIRIVLTGACMHKAQRHTNAHEENQTRHTRVVPANKIELAISLLDANSRYICSKVMK